MTKDKPRVLVADDDQPVQETLQDLLSKQYHVDGVENGEDVLEYLEKHPGLDLLILDIMMPKLNGFQVLAQMKQIDLPVLILSAKSNVSDQIKGITLGAWQYATKPFNMQVLITQVHTLVKLGRTIKSLKDRQQADESKKEKTEEVVERLKKELMELASKVHKRKNEIDSYKINRRHLTPDDIFEGVIETLKSIINMLDTQSKELYTLIGFYFTDFSDIGLKEQFESIDRLIEELFEISESLTLYRINS